MMLVIKTRIFFRRRPHGSWRESASGRHPLDPLRRSHRQRPPQRQALQRLDAGLDGGLGWGPAAHPHGGALAALTAVPGLVGIRAYIRFLREADELLRKIQLEALAIAFGVGVLFMMTRRLFARLRGPAP